MPLDLQTQDQFVQGEIAAVQAQLPGSFQFTLGGIVRALVEAHGRTALWLQSLAAYTLARTRLATSTGADADSFVADFGLSRLPGVAASGLVNFSSFSTTTARYIYPNSPTTPSTVSTSDGSVTFGVTTDTTNPNWESKVGAYEMKVGTATISVPVQALVVGQIGNVGAGLINVINSPIIGVDTVSNPAEFDNGEDVQSDADLRQYFVDYLNSLSRATLTAIEFAIEKVQNNLVYTIVENVDYTTQAQRLGYFYAIVDDGSGTPSPQLLENVSISIDAYRGLTIMYEVQPPEVVLADITAVIHLPAGYSNTNLIQDIKNALSQYIVSIPMGGGTLFYNRVIQLIYNAILADINYDSVFLDQFSITGLTIDGVAGDLTSTAKQAIRVGTYNITTTSP